MIRETERVESRSREGKEREELRNEASFFHWMLDVRSMSNRKLMVILDPVFREAVDERIIV